MARRGEKTSEETKQKQRESNLGKKRSDESKNKMSLSRLGKPSPKKGSTNITKNCLNCGNPFTRPKWVMDTQDCCKVQCGLDYYFKFHRGKNHPHWRNEVSYSKIHAHLLKEYGKAPYCVIMDNTCTKNVEWANIYHKNKNDRFEKNEVANFIPLCESHHGKFDYRRGQKKKTKN